MNEQQRKRHPNALYWSGRDIQEIRFQVLSNIGIQNGDSVLDVGCGFGDFKAWAAGQGLNLHYTGVDLSPDILSEAKKRHADAVFIAGDLFDLNVDAESYDWVILSGALNEQLHDESAYAKAVIKRMYALSRKGVAFNMLNARTLKAHDLHSQIPELMLDFCQEICANCVLHDDYLNNDFSIYMLKSGSFDSSNLR